VGSLLEVLEFMRSEKNTARLIYLSSAAVYGKKNNIAIKENASLNPVSPYGFHKKIAEEICESYSKNFHLNISIVRLFSVYGDDIQKQLLWDACKKISEAGKEVTFFGTGNETRDWIHVYDAVRLFWAIKNSEDKFEILNGASGKKITIKKTLKIVLQEYNKHLKIVFNNVAKKGDPKYYHGNIKKAGSFGWKPNIELDEGIKSFVNNFKKKND
jgi:UDP-glucose 4-epimerase